ncbi:hypothetical protein ACFYYD_26310 [Streptomyces bluensis]|uniref:hypothetical protein n=1 Tax=Streptomyces bluensis TaxID=33897 RepID=UPI00368EA8B0
MNVTETAGTGDEGDLTQGSEPRTRLLPWTGSLGQRCYLIEDGTGHGTLSRIADRVETVQLGLAEQLHEQAWEVLATPTAPTTKIRRLAEQLAQALADTLLIAESRGARLQHPTAPPLGPTPKESMAHGQRPQSRSYDQRMSTAETATQKKVREDFG